MKTVKIVLIVLAVLGAVGLIPICIVSAIVIPQFTEASNEAQLSSLMTDLQTMHSQIELYKIQHNDNLPGVVGGATFVEAMTGQTDIYGAVGTDYGPYVQKIPTNVFTDKDTVDVSGVGIIGDDSHGWDFNPKTGYFQADDSAEHER